MSRILSLLPPLLLSLALAVAADFSNGTAAFAKPAPGPAVFRQACIGCHSVTPDGRMPRLEGVRTSPEEWDNILRRMGRHGYALSAPERQTVIKEISRYQGLTPDESADVSHLAVSPAANLSEHIPDQGTLKITCVSCHSFAKIQSHRRSPDSWAYLSDFHLSNFSASLTQSFRSITWADEAPKATAFLTRTLPYDSAAWRTWQTKRASATASGAWITVGHEVGVGDYEARLHFTPKGNDEYSLTRDLRYADGRKEHVTGRATLFGGSALRCEWTQGGRPIKASFTIAPEGQGLRGERIDLLGSWQAVKDQARYGRESGARLRRTVGIPPILRVSPAWLSPGQGPVEVVVTTAGPALPQWRPRIGDGAVRYLSRRVIDGTHVAFRLTVGAKPRPGKLGLGLTAPRRPGETAFAERDWLTVARSVDYVKVWPEMALARVGGIAVPPDGVAFEAIGYSNGPDGRRHTADDLPLGPVPARFSLAEAFTAFDDDDVEHVGTVTPEGFFMPADEGPDAKSYTGDKVGDVWVVATLERKGLPPLRARGFLTVSAPDLVKPIR